MNRSGEIERPLGVYMVSLYFVLSGLAESIHKYRTLGSSLHWNPLGKDSVWHLAADVTIYLAIAYLVWHLTWLGRLAALVFGYLYLATCLWFFFLYLRGTPLNSDPLFTGLALFHVVALPALLYYLQSQRRKLLFRTSLLDVILPRD